MHRPTHRSLLPWLMAAGALGVYLATLSRYYSGDSIEAYLLVGLVALAPLLLAFRWRHCLWPSQRRPLVVIAVWTALCAAFGFYWVPGDQTFWLPVLVAWWLLVSLVVAYGSPTRLPVTLLAIAVVTLALANAAFEILPRHNLATNRAYQIASRVAAHTGPSDLVLTRSDDIAALYTMYFSDRQVATLVDGDGLDAILSDLENQPTTATVVIVDADQSHERWWQDLLLACTACERGSWRVQTLAWPPQGTLAIQLNMREMRTRNSLSSQPNSPENPTKCPAQPMLLQADRRGMRCSGNQPGYAE